MQKASLGCLLLHGLSSHINCIDPVVDRLEKLGIPYRMPVLRGHMSKPEDLQEVSWQDWYADAEKALKELLQVADKAVIIGLSMGGVVSLDLTLGYQEQLAGLVTIAAALKYSDPRTNLLPLLARFQKKIVFQFNPADYCDPDMLKTNQNYKWIPTHAALQLYRYQQRMRKPNLMAQITIPTLVIATQKDRTIDPKIQQWLYDNLGSKEKTLKWFYRSGHEMLRDGEKTEALDEIEKFVAKLHDRAASELGQKQKA
jgi:carboxylesterase